MRGFFLKEGEGRGGLVLLGENICRQREMIWMKTVLSQGRAVALQEGSSCPHTGIWDTLAQKAPRRPAQSSQVPGEHGSKPAPAEVTEAVGCFPSPFSSLSQSLRCLQLENRLSWGDLAQHQARPFPSYAVVTTPAAHFNLYAFHG